MNKAQQVYKPGGLLKLRDTPGTPGNYPKWNKENNYHSLNGELKYISKRDVLLCLEVQLVNDLSPNIGNRHRPHNIVYICLVQTQVLGFYENEVCLYKSSEIAK